MLEIWRWLKLQKEGILYGAIVGVGLYLFLHTRINTLAAIDSPSLLDKAVVVGTKWKYLIGLILIGSTSGAIVDSIKNPRK